MTNWDKISKALSGLLQDITPDVFAESLASDCTTCTYCALNERCNSVFYVYDENGECVVDNDGDPVVNDNFPGCESIILGYLNEETGEDDAC